MKLRFVLVLAAAVWAAACTQPGSTVRRANPIGTHDLVLVGEPADGFVAAKSIQSDGSFLQVGMPSRFLFVTSADTNDVKLQENFAVGGRTFVAAPNPLETLSIPVLDRPTMLAADEGRNSEGSRVTGPYVYAARPGGAEVSVVSLSQRRQLGGKPFATPAPVTAISGFMEVDLTAPALATPMPDQTKLYVATWDGEFAAVYSAALPTNSPALEKLDFQRVVLIGQTPIAAMLLVAPLASRTLDGAAFCATQPCVALATRSGSGADGQSFLIEPQTGRLANLSFSGPVRKLVSSANGGRIYAVLDEQACGGPACGGIVAVDVVAAVTAAAPPYEARFPSSLDATGAPMRPLRTSGGLITGLTIGSFHRNAEGAANSGTIGITTEVASSDGGSTGRVLANGTQEYNELGAYSSSSGVITFFSGLAGSIIDYDVRRTTVTAASVRLPGLLADGGLSFTAEDGGVAGSDTAASVVVRAPVEGEAWVVADVTTAAGAVWTLDVSDGYLETQSIVFVYQGGVPGLVALPTTAADGLRLSTGGLETRALVGDLVRFETGSETDGFSECGRARVAAIGARFIEVSDVPASCAARTRFSVRADAAKPLVAASDVEGYLGRWAPGETLAYTRPYVLLAPGAVAARTALRVVIPADVGTQEGSITTFQVQGLMAPYRVTLDPTTIAGCFSQLQGQVVLGNMVMDRVPTRITNGAIDYRWSLMGVVPSGNSLLEIPLLTAQLGALSTGQAFCAR